MASSATASALRPGVRRTGTPGCGGGSHVDVVGVPPRGRDGRQGAGRTPARSPSRPPRRRCQRPRPRAAWRAPARRTSSAACCSIQGSWTTSASRRSLSSPGPRMGAVTNARCRSLPGGAQLVMPSWCRRSHACNTVRACPARPNPAPDRLPADRRRRHRYDGAQGGRGRRGRQGRRSAAASPAGSSSAPTGVSSTTLRLVVGGARAGPWRRPLPAAPPRAVAASLSRLSCLRWRPSARSGRPLGAGLAVRGQERGLATAGARSGRRRPHGQRRDGAARRLGRVAQPPVRRVTGRHKLSPTPRLAGEGVLDLASAFATGRLFGARGWSPEACAAAGFPAAAAPTGGRFRRGCSARWTSRCPLAGAGQAPRRGPCSGRARWTGCASRSWRALARTAT